LGFAQNDRGPGSARKPFSRVLTFRLGGFTKNHARRPRLLVVRVRIPGAKSLQNRGPPRGATSRCQFSREARPPRQKGATEPTDLRRSTLALPRANEQRGPSPTHPKSGSVDEEQTPCALPPMTLHCAEYSPKPPPSPETSAAMQIPTSTKDSGRRQAHSGPDGRATSGMETARLRDQGTRNKQSKPDFLTVLAIL